MRVATKAFPHHGGRDLPLVSSWAVSPVPIIICCVRSHVRHLNLNSQFGSNKSRNLRTVSNKQLGIKKHTGIIRNSYNHEVQSVNLPDLSDIWIKPRTLDESSGSCKSRHILSGLPDPVSSVTRLQLPPYLRPNVSFNDVLGWWLVSTLKNMNVNWHNIIPYIYIDIDIYIYMYLYVIYIYIYIL